MCYPAADVSGSGGSSTKFCCTSGFASCTAGGTSCCTMGEVILVCCPADAWEGAGGCCVCSSSSGEGFTWFGAGP